MKDEINQYVRNLMSIYTNIIFTRESTINDESYQSLKNNFNNLYDLVTTNNIQNPSLLEFIDLTNVIFTSYHIINVDPIIGNIFDIDFMIIYNSYAKLKILATKIYNNKYNTRKI